MRLKLVALDYHRNGTGGCGFYVALFRWKDPDQAASRLMVATVFPEPGCVAVLDTTETAAQNIAFANGNSWRGDHFEPWLRKQIKRAEETERRSA